MTRAPREARVSRVSDGAPHVPVLLAEVLEALDLPGRTLAVDGTFGAGGYTRAMLKADPSVHVLAIDRDPGAIAGGAPLVAEAGGRLTLVDMPGYGYAAVEKTKVEAWTDLIHDYLKGRSNLARVFMLIDSRHGLKSIDTDVLDGLDKAAVSYQIVLTKGDALKKSEMDARIAGVQAAIARRPAAYPEILLTSSRDDRGVPELRASVARLLRERGA